MMCYAGSYLLLYFYSYIRFYSYIQINESTFIFGWFVSLYPINVKTVESIEHKETEILPRTQIF